MIKRITVQMTWTNVRVETGIWCDNCALPSLVEVDAMLQVGTRGLRFCTVRQCHDCNTETIDWS